jgi:LDH2 family malate/lactate/ureidoglycolate dehydrogenase
VQSVILRAAVLRDFLGRILGALGCDAENSATIADGLVEADLRGHHIQGTDHLYSVAADLKAGRLNGRARPHILREAAAIALIDGDGGGGHVGGRMATELAIAKARAAGLAAVGLIRANDIFMLGRYVERMARAHLIGMTFTNTVPTRVHPAGGIDPALGTNPIAFGFPTFDGDPIIIDLATSTSAIGHVRMASYSASPIPPGIAIDRNGEPTTDAIEALAGALTPLGGHKGFAIGLAAALLSGPTIGACLGSQLKEQVTQTGRIPERGHLFLAIDPAAFGDVEAYRTRLRAYVAELKGGRRASENSPIRMPGERSLEMRSRSLREGIELPASVWQRTVEIARQTNIDPPAIG